MRRALLRARLAINESSALRKLSSQVRTGSRKPLPIGAASHSYVRCLMEGTLDIQRLSDALSTIERYQIRDEDVIGESFSDSMNREELHDLLYRKLGLGMSNE